MIGKLKGIIDSINEDSLIVDVGGVGYYVHCSGKTLARLGGTGTEVSLIIETHVREDHIHLYGFADKMELEWFRELTNNVQGVGTRLAMTILSALSPKELVAALIAQDKSAFKNISGVGPKLSERLVTELKGKVKGFISGDVQVAAARGDKTSSPPAFSDALSALINLGYSRTDAYSAIMKVANKNEKIEVQELIRASLKELAK